MGSLRTSTEAQREAEGKGEARKKGTAEIIKTLPDRRATGGAETTRLEEKKGPSPVGGGDGGLL